MDSKKDWEDNNEDELNPFSPNEQELKDGDQEGDEDDLEDDNLDEEGDDDDDDDDDDVEKAF